LEAADDLMAMWRTDQRVLHHCWFKKQDAAAVQADLSGKQPILRALRPENTILMIEYHRMLIKLWESDYEKIPGEIVDWFWNFTCYQIKKLAEVGIEALVHQI